MSKTVAKYQRYAEYKDSGIVWMGNVPKHWTSERFKWSLTEKLKTSNPNLPAGSISFGEVIYKNEENLSSDTKASYQEVLKDEFLINPLNLNYDLKSLRTALSKIDVVVSTGYIVLHCNHLLDRNYVRWLLQEFDVAHMKTLGAGVRQTVNFSDIANCYFYLPEQLEQRKIANFLDHETAKIDSLIEKQQQLIQLLKEKRQAVISHAVTKGLNPDVAMKDSGVEWLGQVPQEWMVSRLGYETWIRARLGWKGLKADEYVDDGYIFLATPNIKGKQIDFNNVNYINKQRYEESPEIKLNIGDVLLTKDGSTLGTVNIVRDLPKPATVNSSIAVITPYKNLISEFLLYLLTSSFMVNTIQRIKGGMGVPHLFQADLNKFYLPIPDPAEQFEIFKFLDQETAKIDMLISKAESAIQLMKERRTALISAAVTGKIDVRNWQNPTEAKMEFSA